LPAAIDAGAPIPFLPVDKPTETPIAAAVAAAPPRSVRLNLSGWRFSGKHRGRRRKRLRVQLDLFIIACHSIEPMAHVV
jgi:hypothetical protein